MPATSTIYRAARPAFRSNTFFTSQAQAQSQVFRAARFRNAFAKRWQSTAVPNAEAVQQGWVKRMWNSPIGLKTVHFWAPVMKWGIVLAGVSDFYRPAEKLSLTQNFALTCTGMIWTRWCLIIKPRNILLATVNFFLGVVGVIQVTRIFRWRASDAGKAALAEAAEVKDIKGEVKQSVEGLKQDVKEIVKS